MGDASSGAGGRPAAVILGMKQIGLALARTLGRRGVEVVGIGGTKDDPGLRSRYLARSATADLHGPALVGFLGDLAERTGRKQALFSTDDRQVVLLAENADVLGRHYFLALPAASTIERLIDKASFAEFALEQGLDIPRTVVIDAGTDVGRLAAELTYPCIIKPRIKTDAYMTHVEEKAYRAESARELDAVCRRMIPHEPNLIVQEWIPGGDEALYFCLQYYDAGSEALVSFVGRKVRQWPPATGNTSSAVPVHEPVAERILAASTRAFQAARFTGLGSFEIKLDPRNSRLVFIEPTVGRVDSQFDLMVANGFDLPYVAYLDMTGQGAAERQTPAPTRRAVSWVHEFNDLRSGAHEVRAGRLRLGQLLASWRGPKRFAFFASDDLRPFVLVLTDFLRQVVGGAWDHVRKRLRRRAT